jgi:hypothetical protein
MKYRNILTIAAFLALPSLASAQDMKGMNMGGNPSDQANMAAMEKMQKDMPKKGTGNPDKDLSP